MFDDIYQPIVFNYVVQKNLTLTHVVDIMSIKWQYAKTCSMQTNLFFERHASLHELSLKIRKSESYYFNLRFCEADVVKQSRTIDGRPEFYPTHLPPSHSSWIMMSNNYTSKRMLAINLSLDGLIFVRQIKGYTDFALAIRSDCQDVCPNKLSIRVQENEGLLFTTELWDLSYSVDTSSGKESLSFITETDWK